jgi:hypothetical protein
MAHWIIARVPKDNTGKPLFEDMEVEEALHKDSAPIDKVRQLCEHYPGNLFYIFQSIEYAIGYAKVEVTRTTMVNP